MEGIPRVVFLRAVWVRTHGMEGERLNGRAGGGEGSAVFAITPRSQHITPRPAGGKPRQIPGIEPDRHLIARAKDHEAIIALPEQFRDVTEPCQSAGQLGERDRFQSIGIIEIWLPAIGRVLLEKSARRQARGLNFQRRHPNDRFPWRAPWTARWMSRKSLHEGCDKRLIPVNLHVGP